MKHCADRLHHFLQVDRLCNVSLHARLLCRLFIRAGRCIGALDDAWEVFRVIPVAAMTGEVAGIAAALCAEKGVTPSQLDVKILQQTLKNSRKGLK